MKSIKLSIVATALLLMGAAGVKAQTADEIIDKHVKAVGGAENWKKINTMKMTGAINAGGTEIPVTITYLQNKAMKVEFSMNGMTGYQIVTTKGGWAFNPMAGQTKPEPIPEEMVKESQDQLDIQDKLIDYKAKGSKVVFLGKDDVEGTECYKLKVTTSNGKEETMYIDASNYYHIRSVSKIKANGKEMEQTANYSNYQKLPEGIVFPMNIDEGNGPVALKSVEINKPVDEAIFTPKS